MPAHSTKLGPGTLTLGATDGGTSALLDVSCQVVNAAVTWDKDAEDPINVLCGDTVAGATTYTASMSGSFLQDLDQEDGLVAYTWTHKGESVPVTFTPNTASGAVVTGSLVVDPLNVGSTDDYGTVMQSEFEWAFVGEPLLDWGGTRSDTPVEPLVGAGV